MDYEALAKKYGGSVAPPTVDYGALAKQYGGVVETPSFAGSPSMTAPTGGIPSGRQPMSWGKVASEAVSNLGPSAYAQGQGLVSAVLSPIDTLKTLGKLGGGAALNIMPDKAREIATSIFTNPQSAKEAMDLAKTVGGEYATNYGSLEGFKQKLSTDPVGVVADLSTLFYGGGAAIKGAGLTKTGAAVSSVGSALDPLNIVTAPIRIPIESAKKASVASAQAANAVRDANIASAQAAGYTLTPGSVSPTGKNILAERVAGKTSLEQLSSVKNQTVTDKLVRKSLNLPESAPLTSDTMKGIRATEYNKGYEPVKQIGQLPTDNRFLSDLVDIETKYVGANASFPGSVPPEVEKLIKTYTVGKFDSKDAVNASRLLRDEASANFRKGENSVAKAQLDVANALENQIERHLINTGRPDAHTILEQFKLSRQRMAVSHTVENSIREGSGSVDAKKLASMLQRGDYMTGELKTIAEFANIAPRVTNMPSTIGTPAAGSVLGQNLLTNAALGGGVGGAYGGLPGGLAGLATGAAVSLGPPMVSAGVRKYLMSGAGQRNLLPSLYNTQIPGMSREAMRNMLLASQAGKTYQDLENRNSLRP
jgi:hypothetical protein